MRHRVQSLQLNRDTNHRKHLLRNLVRELVEHGAIVTSSVKAKETKRWADKLIGKAQDDSIATRRVLHRFFGKRDVVNTLVERVAPAMKDRKSGFTTLKSIGVRRGDNTQLVKLSLMVQPDRAGSLRSAKAIAQAAKVTTKSAAKAKPAATKPAAKATESKKAESKKTEAKKAAPAKAVAKPTKKTTKAEKK